MTKIVTFHAGHNAFVTGAHANGYKEEVETRRVVARIAEICAENGVNYAITTDDIGHSQRQNLSNICANCNSHTRDKYRRGYPLQPSNVRKRRCRGLVL